MSAREIDLKPQIQPGSMDLSLGPKLYRVNASCLPVNCTVKERLAQFGQQEMRLDTESGAVLEPGAVYVAKLNESVKLPDYISGVCNPKSTSGRLDLFVRLITDQGDHFDVIPKGYAGPLYVEISPGTFPVRLRTGDCLTQLRLRGRGAANFLTATQLAEITRGMPITPEVGVHDDEGLCLTAHLTGENGIQAYRAKRYTALIDFRKHDHQLQDYWDVISYTGKDHLLLEPNAFYILASRQHLQIPPFLAAEMMPYVPGIGEFRAHYAGFFDPGFGYPGHTARAVLEVRTHNIPFTLFHDQTVAKLRFESMMEEPDALYGSGGQSNYQSQGIRLAKQFAMAA